MKIRLTVDVSENERRYLGNLLRDVQKTRGGLVQRKAIQNHLNAKLRDYFAIMSKDFWESHSKPLTDKEKEDASAAIDYMRKQGKSDGTIRAWLLMQRARVHFAPKKYND